MGLMETIKTVANLTKQIGDIELNTKIIELQSDVFELMEENYNLKQQIDEYKNHESIEKNLIIKGHFYHLKNEDKIDGLFCTSCWDNHKKLIRCHVHENYGVEIADCPVCKFSSSYLE